MDMLPPAAARGPLQYRCTVQRMGAWRGEELADCRRLTDSRMCVTDSRMNYTPPTCGSARARALGNTHIETRLRTIKRSGYLCVQICNAQNNRSQTKRAVREHTHGTYYNKPRSQ